MATKPKRPNTSVPRPGPMITEEQKIQNSNKNYISYLAILGKATWSAVLILGGVAGFLISRITSEGVSQDATILAAAAIRFNIVLAFCLVFIALGVFFFITAYTEQELKGSKNHIGWWLGFICIVASPLLLWWYGYDSGNLIVDQLNKLSTVSLPQSTQSPPPLNN